MATPQTKLFFTVAEYLAFERAAEERHEYLDGQIRAMAGESLEHGRISRNLVQEIGNQLDDSSCEVIAKDMKVRSGPESQTKTKLPVKDFFSYPDVLIFCGQPVFHDKFRDVLLNPKVIIEILSDSTEAFDRGEKFIRYRTYNDTLTDYLLVSQKLARIEHYVRQSDGNWLLSMTSGLESSLRIASVNCHLPLAKIYKRVDFPPPKIEEESETAETESIN